MDELKAMRVFARVAGEGSFAGAARALDLAPAVVTRAVAELEDHLGARLLNRTTRKVALTEVGADYLARVQRILADVEEAQAMAGAHVQEARGLVRLLVPPAVSVHQIAKHLPRFHQRFPLVQLEIDAFGPVEAASEAHDISIVWTREMLSGEFIARRLARTETIVCAAPEYLERRGRPRHPSELAQHDALLPPASVLPQGLTFRRGGFGDDEPAGEEVTLHSGGTAVLRSAHIDTNYAAALAGLGIAGLPSYVVEDALIEHALERVLPEWHLFSATIWATMPSRQHLPARTRAVLEFLLGIFGGEDRDPWLAAAGCETVRA
jgi:DNA-binding transcriptional LysR family regulator